MWIVLLTPPAGESWLEAADFPGFVVQVAHPSATEPHDAVAMSLRTHRFAAPTPITLGGYDLDAFVVEDDDQAPHLGFRFELGRGLGIYHALPAGPNDRLRLVHVDGAAYTVDEPVVIADPWVCELPRLEWPGGQMPLAGGARLVSVAIAMQARPASYRCELLVATRSGHEWICLHWHEPSAPEHLG